MIEKVTIRSATPGDSGDISALTTRAFGRPDEAAIIAKLEADGDALMQLVGLVDGVVVSHVMFYQVGVLGRLGAAGLGPMSVDPSVQRAKIGSTMTGHGLSELKRAGVPLVFVLGHPEYYPRFGFSVAETEPFESSLKGPAFMAARLRYGPPMSGKLIFPKAFEV